MTTYTGDKKTTLKCSQSDEKEGKNKVKMRAFPLIIFEISPLSCSPSILLILLYAAMRQLQA